MGGKIILVNFLNSIREVRYELLIKRRQRGSNLFLDFLEPLLIIVGFSILFGVRSLSDNVIFRTDYLIKLSASVIYWHILRDYLIQPMPLLIEHNAQRRLNNSETPIGFIMRAYLYATIKNLPHIIILIMITIFFAQSFGKTGLSLIVIFSASANMLLFGLILAMYNFYLKNVRLITDIILRPLMFISGVIVPLPMFFEQFSLSWNIFYWWVMIFQSNFPSETSLISKSPTNLFLLPIVSLVLCVLIWQVFRNNFNRLSSL